MVHTAAIANSYGGVFCNRLFEVPLMTAAEVYKCLCLSKLYNIITNKQMCLRAPESLLPANFDSVVIHYQSYELLHAQSCV